MAKIGANLCCLYDEAEEQEKFLSVITDAEWGITLGKLEVMQHLRDWTRGSQVVSLLHDLTFIICDLAPLQISIQPVFRQRPEMKSSLIPVLVKNRRITPDIILQYCRSATQSAVSICSVYFNVELNFGSRLC